jgi:hypothetical protein
LARDNHPRDRQAAKLKRKQGTRPPYDRVLIVCEGEKTEPNYFDEIRVQLRIPTAHVQIMPSALGTQPRQVVDYAVEKFGESREFDIVYAVFDRDDHDTYHDGLAQAGRLNETLKNDEKKKVPFFAVPSIPCFELWVLIHFIEIHAFADRHTIIGRLKTYIADYEKGRRGVFALTASNLNVAMERAVRLREQFSRHNDEDLYTSIDEVVTKLLSLRPAR